MQIMELIGNENKVEKGIWHISDVNAISQGCGISVYLFWQQPKINIGFYPTIQIEGETGKTVKHAEGPEDPDMWSAWIEDELSEYRNVNDFENA